MSPRLRVLLLALALLASLGLAFGAVSAQPRGPEPNLPAGNGEIYGAATGIRPSDGTAVMCFAWRTKQGAVKLVQAWGCYDVTAQLACERITATGVADAACRPYASGVISPDEARGAIAGALYVLSGELWAVYTTSAGDDSTVTPQEYTMQRLGVPLLAPVSPALPHYRTFTPVLTP